MSTKCSISWGDNYHFYEEALDREAVYLRLDGCELCKSEQEIRIPIDIWRQMLKGWEKSGWSEDEDHFKDWKFEMPDWLKAKTSDENE